MGYNSTESPGTQVVGSTVVGASVVADTQFKNLESPVKIVFRLTTKEGMVGTLIKDYMHQQT